MEGLSVLIKEYEKRNNLTGIQVARRAPRLTHMFFADDTYSFCKANEREADHIVDLLQIFERASGQKINAAKSSVFFSRNTAQEFRDAICAMLRFKEAGDNTTYLGLPSMLGRNKSAMLGYLKDRMKEKVQGWDKKWLSRGGKELLLKTVAQGWRLLVKIGSLVERVFKARYYPEGFFLSANVGSNPSYIWRSIMEAQIVLKRGVVRRVGTGTTVSITKDPWLPNDDPYVHTDNEAIRDRNVDALMIPGQYAWDVDVIKDVFVDRDAKLILSIPLRDADSDCWFWKWDKKGQYTVRSAYTAIQEVKQSYIQNDSISWKKLWNAKVPLKVKHFIWRVVRNILPTKDQLLTRRVDVNDKCPVCNDEIEAVYHVLVTCSMAKQCWNALGINTEENNSSNFDRWVNSLFQKCKIIELQEVFMVCWSLWNNRNEVIWNQRGKEYSDVCKLAKLLLNQWKNAQDKSFDHFLGFMGQEDGKERWEYP
ncbi:uncharacterized protein LOC141665405 [Apium graveolens]|uniref:uncharacterized protein LOC141665405 n=1 Tax=Apium graveolens TaxID=4045 RepID=UPI003D7A1E6E